MFGNFLWIKRPVKLMDNFVQSSKINIHEFCVRRALVTQTSFMCLLTGMRPPGPDDEWGENMRGGPLMPGGPGPGGPGMPPGIPRGLFRGMPPPRGPPGPLGPLGPPGPMRGRGGRIYMLYISCKFYGKNSLDLKTSFSSENILLLSKLVFPMFSVSPRSHENDI